MTGCEGAGCFEFVCSRSFERKACERCKKGCSMQRLLWRHLVDAKKFEQGYLNLEEKNEGCRVSNVYSSTRKGSKLLKDKFFSARRSSGWRRSRNKSGRTMHSSRRRPRMYILLCSWFLRSHGVTGEPSGFQQTFLRALYSYAPHDLAMRRNKMAGLERGRSSRDGRQ